MFLILRLADGGVMFERSAPRVRLLRSATSTKSRMSMRSNSTGLARMDPDAPPPTQAKLWAVFAISHHLHLKLVWAPTCKMRPWMIEGGRTTGGTHLPVNLGTKLQDSALH